MRNFLLATSTLVGGLAPLYLVSGDAQANDYGESNPITSGAQRHNLPIGASKTLIDAHGLCRWVSNNAALNVHVPLKSTLEWSMFVANAPSTIPRDGCCMPTSVSLCDSSWSLGYGHSGHGPYNISAGYSKTGSIACNGSAWVLAETGGECDPPPPPPPPGGFGGSGGDSGGNSGSHDTNGDGTTDTAGTGGRGFGADSTGGIGSASNDASDGGTGGCFVTTAVCTLDGKADTCHELTMMRALRADHVAMTETGCKRISVYEAVAPEIVEKLAAREDGAEVLRNAKERWIDPGVSLIDEGRLEEASSLYQEMMASLIFDVLLVDEGSISRQSLCVLSRSYLGREPADDGREDVRAVAALRSGIERRLQGRTNSAAA